MNRLITLALLCAATAHAGQWECMTKTDTMTGEVYHTAGATSSNRVAALPWETPAAGLMSAIDGAVSVAIPGVGLVECQGCTMRIKIDGVLSEVRGEESGRWVEFKAPVMGARQVVVEVPVFRSKPAVLTFDLDNACPLD